MLQLFGENRSLRRDGVEVLGYDRISKRGGLADQTGRRRASRPQRRVVPRMIGAALFETKRERRGGLLEAVQAQRRLHHRLVGLRLQARRLQQPQLPAVQPAHDRRRRLARARLRGAQQHLGVGGHPGAAGTQYGLYDMIARPDEKASTTYLSLDAAWRVSDSFQPGLQARHLHRPWRDPTQNVAEWRVGGTGASWGLNGIDEAASFSLNENTSAPQPNLALDWIFGLQNLDIEDKDKWGPGRHKILLRQGRAELAGIRRALRQPRPRIEQRDRAGPGCAPVARWCRSTGRALVPGGDAFAGEIRQLARLAFQLSGDFGSGFGGASRNVLVFQRGRHGALQPSPPATRSAAAVGVRVRPEGKTSAYAQFNLEATAGTATSACAWSDQPDVLQYWPAAPLARRARSIRFGVRHLSPRRSSATTQLGRAAQRELQVRHHRFNPVAACGHRDPARPDHSALAGGFACRRPTVPTTSAAARPVTRT